MPTSEPRLDPNAHILILTPNANSHRRDFDHVFRPESELLARLYRSAHCQVVRVPVAPIDPNTLRVLSGQRAFEAAASHVLDALRDGTPWTHVIMLCHGWATGLQLGFRCRGQRGNDAVNLAALRAALKALPVATLTLFACSAGADPQSPLSSPGTGEGSLSDHLRDESGVAVLAHLSVGHACRNPNLIFFARSPLPLIGGTPIAAARSALAKNAARLLGVRKDPRTNKFLSDTPPRGHGRPAFASLPLCTTGLELQALLSSEPG